MSLLFVCVVDVDVDVDVGVVDVDVVDVDVEAVDVDVAVLFVDEPYVCSSVAGSLCSTPKARYPQNCGVTVLINHENIYTCSHTCIHHRASANACTSLICVRICSCRHTCALRLHNRRIVFAFWVHSLI